MFTRTCPEYKRVSPFRSLISNTIQPHFIEQGKINILYGDLRVQIFG